MRVFLAGATGVIGVRLVPELVVAGYEVVAMTRSAAKVGALEAAGATAVVCDVYDAGALRDAVVAARPDIVVHELTDLPDDAAQIGDGSSNARIRREGTRNLIAAAQAAHATRFLAQSVAWAIPGDGGDAVAELERAVLAIDGVVLRYGRFYGAGTYSETELPEPPRIGVDDAARRTVAALLTALPGVLTIAE